MLRDAGKRTHRDLQMLAELHAEEGACPVIYPSDLDKVISQRTEEVAARHY